MAEEIDVTLFDKWTEDDENQAIQAARKETTVKHIIKNNEFWALAPMGRIYKLPINLSLADFKKLSEAREDTDQLSVLSSILAAFAGEEQAKDLEREPFLVTTSILTSYGETLGKIQGVDLGKSQNSTSSSTETSE